jgi:hypothetical protein
MPLETLEEIRLLSNLETSHDKLMQIVLFGQPELDQHLSLPNMRQLKERITHSFNLLPLPARDIKDYLNFRLRAAGYKGPDLFGPEALKLIAEASEGLTRRINIYADKTLLAAYAAGTHTITPDFVRAAISDTRIVLPASNVKTARAWLASALALVAGLAIGFVAGRFTAPEPVPAVAPTVARAVAPIQPAPAPAPANPSTDNAAKGAIVTAPVAVPAGAEAKHEGTKPADASVLAALPVAAPVPSSGPVTVAAEKSAEKDWLTKRMDADVARLAALPGDRYAIQLMTADQREKAAIESFLRVASKELNPDRVMVYPSGTLDNPKVSVLYSHFPERADAAAEISGLPTKLSAFRPYVRSIQAIRSDIRAGN